MKFDVSDEKLRELYLSRKSSLVIASEYGVSKKSVLDRLQALPDWPFRNKKIKQSKQTDRQDWELKFIDLLKTVHKRNISIKAKRLLKRIDSTKNSMMIRSKKYNVECNITVNDLRELVLSKYGTPCKFSNRILTLDNMVFDHIIPISKMGTSNKENIQIISKFSNNMKGSLMEDQFQILLDWLETIPVDLKRDISIRLAGGKSYSKQPGKSLLIEDTSTT